ncbi:hypothetical protein T492DRAFT_841891 [Pavlovales sp. CCMP2436]|nr:hypothetical protein T492DRAFT_841891 [Pavlovales sp. CCMP2436]
MSHYARAMSSSADRVQESLPSFLNYKQKSIAPPCQSARFYLTPSNGSTFSSTATSGPVMRFDIPCGSGGTHLNGAETVLVFTVVNTTGQSLTLDGSALACIDALDVYAGSTHISSIQSYANYVNTLSDFTTIGSHYARGVADFDLTQAAGALTGAMVKAAVGTRNGVTIATGDRATFSLPIVNFLGSLAMKSIPLSQIKDSLRLEVRLSGGLDWGVASALPTVANSWGVANPRLWLTHVVLDGAVESALIASLPNSVVHVPCFDVQSFMTSVPANTGSFTYQIPLRVSSLNMILVTLRETAGLGQFDYRALSRTRGNIDSYRFRIGSQIIPSSYIDCSGTPAEARMELMRALNQTSSSEAHSFVTNDQYALEGANGGALSKVLCGGFAFALTLSAMQMAEILSDGRSTRNEYVTMDVKFRSITQPALRVDIYCQTDMVLVCEGGILHYEN